jgi:murein DD-endopeptidase MepM/ murein hydrolase activator NlpD
MKSPLRTALVLYQLLHIAPSNAQELFTGIWRQSADQTQLVNGLEWGSFLAKWDELSKNNLRLYDLETYMSGGKRFYSGLWRSGVEGHFLLNGITWDMLNAKCAELAQKNLRLADVETYYEGGQRRYLALWRQGLEAHTVSVASDWTVFSAQYEEMTRQNLRLSDFECYVESGQRKYLGVWKPGAGAHFLQPAADWSVFNAKITELARQNLRLDDLEAYEEGGQRKYIGFWRQNSDDYLVWNGVDWENFQSKWAENTQRNLCLIDFETMDSGCDPKCLNSALFPDNPETDWRDGFDYPIAAGLYHCEGPPGICSSAKGGANVTYRRPHLRIGDQYYLRTSVLYDAKDQIFSLPFKKGQPMTKSGRPAGAGNWRHSLQYERSDRKSFEVCAAAAGRVIYAGWDSWSGNTVVVSHDARGLQDMYRTIYMHLRNGPAHDCEAARSKTLPSLNGDNHRNYAAYLDACGCPENKAARNPDELHWGTEAQALDMTLLGKTVRTGDVLGWAGETGSNGCANGDKDSCPCLYVFFAHRDPAANQWFLFDPHGIYGAPECYPAAVDGPVNTPCARYPSAWKGGKPGYGTH